MSPPPPQPVSAYFTLFNPMDMKTWVATGVALAAVVVVVVAADCLLSGSPVDDVFFADAAMPYAILMQLTVPHGWFER